MILLEQVFECAAGLFDEIMIDDFWFTDRACPECDAARKAKTATVGEELYSVSGDRREDFKAPNRVALYLFEDGSGAVENFNDAEATVEWNGERLKIPARGWVHRWK